ncbi:hypothetical protein SNE40_000639 [Patella caerulea]|uniref:Uncharacterized protein n=1 Tax=Patella caerulea TaxID=87958 RepID=A0AAN8KAY3_PATCE
MGRLFAVFLLATCFAPTTGALSPTKPYVETCFDCSTKDCHAVRGTHLCHHEWVRNSCPMSCGECGKWLSETKQPICHVDDSVCKTIVHKDCQYQLIKKTCTSKCGGTIQTTTPVPKPTSQTMNVFKRKTTTPIVKTQKPHITRICHVCEYPFCDMDFEAVEACVEWKPYCMNYVKIDESGSKSIQKRCVSEVECDYEWLNKTSTRQECQFFDNNKIYTTPFSCQFCCQTNNCNRNTVPHVDTLKKNKA